MGYPRIRDRKLQECGGIKDHWFMGQPGSAAVSLSKIMGWETSSGCGNGNKSLQGSGRSEIVNLW